MIRRFVSIASVVAALTATGAPIAGAAVSFQGLGALPGPAFYSFPRAVSSDGGAVVGKSISATNGTAFLWTPGGGMVPVGNNVISEGYGISDNHAIIVGQYLNEASRWTSSTGMTSIGDLPGGNGGGRGLAVTGDGSVIVGSSFSTSGLETYRWTAAGGMVGLGDLPGGNFMSEAFGVSDDGSVIVGYGTDAAGEQPMRWTAAGGMTKLGTVPAGFIGGIAGNITADGSVVSGQLNITGSTSEAFRWTATDGYLTLGDLAGGADRSIASGISDDGSIIIGFGTTASGTAPFIWDAASGMRNLQTVLVNDLGLDLTGWTLQNATDVSADGRTIVGYGLDPAGNTEAWIATVPEPAAAGLMAVVVTALSSARRRRSTCAGMQSA